MQKQWWKTILARTVSVMLQSKEQSKSNQWWTDSLNNTAAEHLKVKDLEQARVHWKKIIKDGITNEMLY